MESSQDDGHLFSEFWEDPGIPINFQFPRASWDEMLPIPSLINESFRKLYHYNTTFSTT